MTRALFHKEKELNDNYNSFIINKKNSKTIRTLLSYIKGTQRGLILDLDLLIVN